MGFGALFLVAVGVAIVYLLGWPSGRSAVTRQDMNDSPLEILKKRYARGELTREEYQELRDELAV